MRLLDSYPVVVTPAHKDCVAFYRRWLAAEVLFEASWFALLTLPGEPGARVAFMAPDHPSTPPGAETFSGDGLFLTFQVEDAGAEFTRLKGEGAPFAYPLTTEPWGQKRFALKDPAGTWLDIVEQVQPADGFWDPYLDPSR